jgi:hypothetical protein
MYDIIDIIPITITNQMNISNMTTDTMNIYIIMPSGTSYTLYWNKTKQQRIIDLKKAISTYYPNHEWFRQHLWWRSREVNDGDELETFFNELDYKYPLIFTLRLDSIFFDMNPAYGEVTVKDNGKVGWVNHKKVKVSDNEHEYRYVLYLINDEQRTARDDEMEDLCQTLSFTDIARQRWTSIDKLLTAMNGPKL